MSACLFYSLSFRCAVTANTPQGGGAERGAAKGTTKTRRPDRMAMVQLNGGRRASTATKNKGGTGLRKMESSLVVPSRTKTDSSSRRICRVFVVPRLVSRPVAVNHSFASVALRLPSRHHGRANVTAANNHALSVSISITSHLSLLQPPVQLSMLD